MIRLLALTALVAAVPAEASTLEGPGRFCGFGPVVDLEAGERVTPIQNGVHSGTFRWEGRFGTLLVRGTGWASPLKAETDGVTAKGHLRLRERHDRDGYVVAIWNRRHAVAYATSDRPLTTEQRAAIDRIDLFDEGEEPTGCKLRTVFVVEEPAEH